MKLIMRGLAVLGLLAVLFLIYNIYSQYSHNDLLTRAGMRQTACDRTAGQFTAAAPANQDIQVFNQFNGLDSGAWALAVQPDGNLVVGGDFTHAGDTTAQHIALWRADARIWQTLGSGLPDAVHELVSTPRGSLFALTRFKPENNQAVIKIYIWKNQSWQPLPELFVGPSADTQDVEAMVSDNQDGFFIGGNFSAAGGMAVNGVIHWNGQTWQPLTGAMPENGLFKVHAMALAADGRLIAGGDFKAVSGKITERVLAWDHDRWSQIGANLSGWVESLAAARNGQLSAVVYVDFYKEGQGPWVLYTLSPGTNQWILDPQGFPMAQVQFQSSKSGMDRVSLAVQPLTADQAELANWDGSLWQARVYPNDLIHDPKHPIRLYTFSQKAYVVGEFITLDGAAAANIAEWNGQSWQALISNNMPLSGISGVVNSLVVDHRGDLIAGGNFQTAGGSLAANIARWDGTGWFPLADGLNGSVSALAIDPQGRVVAAGNFSQAGGIEALGVARFDPATGAWEGLTHREDPFMGMATALAITPDGDVYTAGLGSFSGKGQYYVANWDGRKWTVLPGFFDQGVNVLMSDHQGRIYAGGSFHTLSGEAMVGVARWDKSSGRWTNLGSNLGWIPNDYNSVNTLLEGSGGSVLVGGNFTSVGGKTVCHIAHLLPDANQGKGEWEQLAGGLPWLFRMALGPDGSLYAATILPRPNGESDDQLVVLPPSRSSWQLLGGIIGELHTYREVNALVINTQGKLAMGGIFAQVGEQPAENIAFLQVKEK